MKILAVDIESLPNIAATFRLWNTTIGHQDIIEDQSIICIAWKWVGESKVHITSIADDVKRLKKSVYDDYVPTHEFYKVLNSDEDYVCLAHNGDRFDFKKINTAFIKHGLKPVQERQTIDTLKQARKYFKFDSNKLDYIGRYLEVGEKIQTGGMSLWRDIFQLSYPPYGKEPDFDRCEKALKKMARYNKQDVNLLVSVFEKLKPYIKIPSAPLYNGQFDLVCPSCGGKDFYKHGHRFTQTGKYQAYGCRSCGKRFQGKQRIATVQSK